MIVRSPYEAAGSAQAVLDGIVTFEDFQKANPIRKVGENWHLILDGFSVHVGSTLDAARWAQRRSWLTPFHRLAGVVWC